MPHIAEKFTDGPGPGADAPWPRPVLLKLRDELRARSPLTAAEFQAGLQDAQRRGVSVPESLVSLSYVSERMVYEALSAVTGLALLDLDEAPVSTLAIRLVPERVARRHDALPVAEDNRTLTYATARPFDPGTEQDMSFASGRQAQPALARPSQLAAAFDRFYPRESDVDGLLRRLRGTSARPGRARPRAQSESPITELCDHIVSGAIASGASDVHIEPFTDGAIVRYRIDGILETIFTVPPEAVAQMTNRFKVLARADIATHHRPQDGAFNVDVDGRAVFVRLSTMPTVYGETVVLRVIDSDHHLATLDTLGYEPDSLARFSRAIERPDGLVLITGPTGCGKTTVLYAALHALRNGRRSIVSVEDPVERRIEGINQIPVNVAAGTSFAAILKSVLRQDPNVLMVGEIRDNEVAQIVGQAAYTGHLVLSSMHTGDAASAMTRLLNLGLEPYKVAESLTAVVAQRLVRKLCPACRAPEAVAPEGPGGPGPAAGRMRPGTGCAACKHTGYVDRVAVAEVFTPTDDMRVAIAKGITAVELRGMMKTAGHRSMRDAGMALVNAGVTSLAELNRVLAEDADERRKVGGRKRVLIVDDDRMIRTLVKLLLERDGYSVLQAEDGREGLDMAKVERPDLVITDLLMPDVDGYQVLGALRSDAALSLLPVVVLTAETGPGTERTVLDLGADDYLVKPLDEEGLLRRVRSIFARQPRLAA
ncbi:MAG: type II/IV secretion system protein [Acidobacteria bacterium]|nr:type II/IV secretion system protein [Acidobacteriota bacterium]